MTTMGFHISGTLPAGFDAVTHGALLRVLNAAPVFRTLTDDELVGVAMKSERVTADRKRTLCKLGDGGIYVLGRGRVRVFRPCGDREMTLEYCGAGEVLGETSIWDNRVDAEVFALEPTESVRVPLSIVKQLIGLHGPFTAALMHVFHNRRRLAEHRVHAMLSRDVESRVAEFILDVAAKHGVPDPRGVLVEFKFTHQEIADFVGSTRETVTLVMGALKKDGVVIPDHRRALIRDLDQLRAKV